jgi:K+-sensing histidine kinase KdpD
MKMTGQIRQFNIMNADKINFIHPNRNRKLMLVIDQIEESEKLLDWINNFKKQTNFKWLALFGESDLSEPYLNLLHEKFQVAEKLGAEKIFCLRTSDITTLLKIAVANNATHIICSKSIKRRIRIFLSLKKIVKTLSIQNGEIDIFCLNADDDLKLNRIIFGRNN